MSQNSSNQVLINFKSHAVRQTEKERHFRKKKIKLNILKEENQFNNEIIYNSSGIRTTREHIRQNDYNIDRSV